MKQLTEQPAGGAARRVRFGWPRWGVAVPSAPSGGLAQETEVRRQRIGARRQKSVSKALGVRVKDGVARTDGEQEVEKQQVVRTQVVFRLSELGAFHGGGGACE